MQDESTLITLLQPFLLMVCKEATSKEFGPSYTLQWSL